MALKSTIEVQPISESGKRGLPKAAIEVSLSLASLARGLASLRPWKRKQYRGRGRGVPDLVKGQGQGQGRAAGTGGGRVRLGGRREMRPEKA